MENGAFEEVMRQNVAVKERPNPICLVPTGGYLDTHTEKHQAPIEEGPCGDTARSRLSAGRGERTQKKPHRPFFAFEFPKSSPKSFRQEEQIWRIQSPLFLALTGGEAISGRKLYISEKGDSLPYTIPNWLVLI